jgi:adenylate cyclase
MSLFAELQRRNVIRMAGLYLVVAWLTVQLAELLLPPFGVPDGVLHAVTVMLALGFVPALVFSWVYELTSEGVKRESEITPEQSMASSTGRRMDRLILVGLLVIISLLMVERFWPSERAVVEHSPSAMTGEASIAVLPFVNMSPDADNEYFADGISEELLNVLAGIEGLKVASRTSAFSFKDKDTSIADIARLLDVRHVLAGSVRKQGQRVRIAAQLIHADSDNQLWAQTYERDLVDIFGVQEDIARAITAELEGLLGQRQVQVRAPTADLEAYERFLSGRARFHRRAELAEAIGDLNVAVEQDPEFAEAWVYLAATHSVAPSYIRTLRPIESNAATAPALEQAQRLVPNHPLGLAVEGQMLTESRDLVGALDRLSEAAELSRLDPTPVMWLGYMLLRSGYIDESIEVLERAKRMDPLVGINHGQLAMAYLSAGDRQRAEAEAALALDRGWAPAQYIMAMDLLASKERSRGIAALVRFLEPRWPDALESPEWSAFNAALEDPDRVDAYWETRPKPYALEESIGLGRIDLLLDHLERSDYTDLDNQDFWFWLRSAWLPSTAALREDPRFFAAAADLGLVTLWETRGYPPGCQRVTAASGDHLDCPGMRR